MLLIFVVISTDEMVIKANKKNAKESEKPKTESKETNAKKDDKKKKKNISEMKNPITVSGKVNVTKNCMFGEIISTGGIEVRYID